ncbi:MAG TPA: hypothetical protein VK866_09185 [Acidimicrobiales bacterium]|nr:hypothetical protein [Acidimicrobiales bacterium]
MRAPSILYILKEYPQISQTYIEAELRALEDSYDVTIVTRRGPDIAFSEHHPYRTAAEPDELQAVIDEVRPDIIHTHYLDMLHVVGPLAERNGLPFTVRSHSYDTLALRPKSVPARIRERLPRVPRPLGRAPHFREGLRWLQSDLCLGVLGFPYSRPWLEDAGAPADKLIDSFPVIDVSRFEDHGPNGDGVMNTGVATPKKKMGDFIDLAARVPERDFRLYAMGYHVDQLADENTRAGSPMEIVAPVAPSAMPAEYKRHEWLVYTADPELATVGWPMAIAEAQASGVGVLMPDIRPDLAQYVGDAGYLYRSLDEAAELVRGPVPPEIREAGFAQARRSDIRANRHLLTDLWDRVAAPSDQTV